MDEGGMKGCDEYTRTAPTFPRRIQSGRLPAHSYLPLRTSAFHMRQLGVRSGQEAAPIVADSRWRKRGSCRGVRVLVWV